MHHEYVRRWFIIEVDEPTETPRDHRPCMLRLHKTRTVSGGGSLDHFIAHGLLVDLIWSMDCIFCSALS